VAFAAYTVSWLVVLQQVAFADGYLGVAVLVFVLSVGCVALGAAIGQWQASWAAVVLFAATPVSGIDPFGVYVFFVVPGAVLIAIGVAVRKLHIRRTHRQVTRA
jgi:hypothetical protein